MTISAAVSSFPADDCTTLVKPQNRLPTVNNVGSR